MSKDITYSLNEEDRINRLIRIGMSWITFVGITLIHISILMFEEKIVGDVTGLEKWLCIVLIGLITSCRVFVAMSLFGLLVTSYCFRKEIKLMAIGAILAMIGFGFFSLFFNQSYPEAVLHVVGLVGLVWLVNERLHGIFKEPIAIKAIKERQV